MVAVHVEGIAIEVETPPGLSPAQGFTYRCARRVRDGARRRPLDTASAADRVVLLTRPDAAVDSLLRLVEDLAEEAK